MAPDVIDLVSSSPTSHFIPPSSQWPKNNDTELEKQQPPSIDITDSTKASHVPVSSGLFLSDDFDTTIDLDEPALTDIKRRLSSESLQPRILKHFSHQCEGMGMVEFLPTTL
jgi:crossover junction endonuclease EME1